MTDFLYVAFGVILFSLPEILGDPVTIREWNLKGLPSDATSAENGILATRAERWGL